MHAAASRHDRRDGLLLHRAHPQPDRRSPHALRASDFKPSSLCARLSMPTPRSSATRTTSASSTSLNPASAICNALGRRWIQRIRRIDQHSRKSEQPAAGAATCRAEATRRQNQNQQPSRPKQTSPRPAPAAVKPRRQHPLVDAVPPAGSSPLPFKSFLSSLIPASLSNEGGLA